MIPHIKGTVIILPRIKWYSFGIAGSNVTTTGNWIRIPQITKFASYVNNIQTLPVIMIVDLIQESGGTWRSSIQNSRSSSILIVVVIIIIIRKGIHNPKIRQRFQITSMRYLLQRSNDCRIICCCCWWWWWWCQVGGFMWYI